MAAESTLYVIDGDLGVRAAVGELADTLGVGYQAFTSGKGFRDAYSGSSPGCVITEVRLRDGNGLQVMEHLTSRRDLTPVVFVAARASVAVAVRAMRAGAFHFLAKPVHETVLWDVVLDALRADARYRKARAWHREREQRLDRLTEKELQILEHIAEGRANREISTELGISMRTVEHRRARMMKKLGAGSITELLHFAVISCRGAAMWAAADAPRGLGTQGLWRESSCGSRSGSLPARRSGQTRRSGEESPSAHQQDGTMACGIPQDELGHA